MAATVQLAKCDKNVDFFIKKIAMLERKIQALAEAVGFEQMVVKKDEKNGQAKA